MASPLFGTRTALILPLVLLTVAMLEEIATYKVRLLVPDLHLRAALVMALNGVAFAIAAGWISPWFKRIFASARTRSRRVGAVGLWIFYAIAYGALYYAYFVAEVRGPGGLLPAAWR
jgi:hypothetical protein